ncbi:MAG: methyltransferase domain-containing protein [Alphaproteobacteria bacterium]|nr:methyltransferase domain-containing protein [Alphaproteobacteria bacterium]
MAEPHGGDTPSPWVARFATLAPPGGAVLDLACGGGRHARLFRGLGHDVTAVDRDADALSALAGDSGIETLRADLEDGSPWPAGERRFAAVVVANYLHRPLLPRIVAAVDDGGVLIYETFAAGNERFGRPRNPDFLLRPGELLEAVRGTLRVVAFEDGQVETPRPAAVQRICAVRAPDPAAAPPPLHGP